MSLAFPGVPHFALSEFKHPELVNHRAAMLLSAVREAFGKEMILTDDARLPGSRPAGGSLTSLHYAGRAFDIRCKDWSREEMWKFVYAVQAVADTLPASEAGVELEIVWSSTDKHVHVGFFLNGQPNRLLVKAE